MIAELSHFLLILAFVLLSTVVLLSLVVSKNSETMIDFIGTLSRSATLSLSLCFFGLVLCFLTDEFSLFYVASNSSSSTPIFHKIFCVLSGYDGSMLFFLVCLSCWKTFSILRGFCDSLQRDLIITFNFFELGICSFILFFANPFARSLPNFPLDGRGLNPQLYDLMFFIHPLTIIIGFAAAAVPCCYCLASMLNEKSTHFNFLPIRPHIVISWFLLLIGIFSGCYWAYNSIGWGGWWFWDPIQNTTLLPFLTTTALLHVTKYDYNNTWYDNFVIILAVLPFIFSLMVMFLIRSGIILSIHGFAVDYASGIYLLTVFLLDLGFVLTVIMLNMDLRSNFVKLVFSSREFFLIGASSIIFAATCSIFFTVTAQLFYKTVLEKSITFGSPFFNFSAAIYGVVILVFMLCALSSRWGISIKKVSSTIISSGIFSFILSLLSWYHLKSLALPYILILFIALWTMFAYLLKIIHAAKLYILNDKLYCEQNWGMLIGHFGFSVLVLGILVVSEFSKFTEFELSQESSANAFDKTVIFDSVSQYKDNNFHGTKLNISVIDNNDVVLLTPKLLRFYSNNVEHADIAVKNRFSHDIQIFIERQLSSNEWELYFAYIPYMSIIWLGLVLVSIAGIFSIYRSRKRCVND